MGGKISTLCKVTGSQKVQWWVISDAWNGRVKHRFLTRKLFLVIPGWVGSSKILQGESSNAGLSHSKDAMLTWNQSIVQQLISDGNLRSRLRNTSPIGLIVRTMWSWSRQCWTNILNNATAEPSVCFSLSRCLHINTPHTTVASEDLRESKHSDKLHHTQTVQLLLIIHGKLNLVWNGGELVFWCLPAATTVLQTSVLSLEIQLLLYISSI